MPLHAPPTDSHDLSEFPSSRIARRTSLYRIWRPYGRSGSRRGAFWFASIPPEGADDHAGRYALSPPHGACYLATSPIGAWLETFRDTRHVDVVDLRARSLLATATPRGIVAADLCAPAARGYGVTGEIHTTGDYRLSRAWAARLHQAGRKALIGLARHDPGMRQSTVTLLDDGGSHPPYGWQWPQRTSPLVDADDLLVDASAYGFRGAAAVPFDVPVADPSA